MADLLVIFFILAAIALLIAWIVRFVGGSRPVAINEQLIWPADVPSTLSQILVRVVPQLTAVGYRLDAQTDRTMIFTRTIRPGWTIVVAILLFPFGLVALLVKSGVSLSVTLAPRGEETDVSVAGTGTPVAEAAFAELSLAGRPA